MLNHAYPFGQYLTLWCNERYGRSEVRDRAAAVIYACASLASAWITTEDGQRYRDDEKARLFVISEIAASLCKGNNCIDGWLGRAIDAVIAEYDFEATPTGSLAEIERGLKSAEVFSAIDFLGNSIAELDSDTLAEIGARISHITGLPKVRTRPIYAGKKAHSGKRQC